MRAKADIHHLLWECPKYKATIDKHRPAEIASLEGWTNPPGPENTQRRILRERLDFIYGAKLDVVI